MNVVLVNPEIPPNTGNIARLCAATDTTLHIIRPIGFFLDDKSLKRAGLDYWPHVDLKVHDSIEELISIGGRQFWYLTKNATRHYTKVEFKEDDYLVFGSETNGLPDDLLSKNGDFTLSIPMFGKTRCINLSNAVAVVLYEALRQVRGF